jgi:hypothetical protein
VNPLVFENPDGSLHHALPTGKRYKKGTPGTPPGDRLAREWVAWDPELLIQVERIYGRHERVFLVLLFLQFLLENSFNALLIKHKSSTIHEILKTYPFMPLEWGQIAFWVSVGLAIGFSATYYVLSAIAVWERKTKWMRIFSEAALVGILGQVMFAYINRFNLILFFLRFIVFAHARFLLSILDGSARIIVTRLRPVGDISPLPREDPNDVVIQV